MGRILLLLLLLLPLGACAPTAMELSRQDLLQRLAPMRDLGTRLEELQYSASLAQQLGISVTVEEAESLKNHMDLYWLHYYAANVAIANQDVARYEEHLQLSEFEIDAIESTLEGMIHRPQPDRLSVSPAPRLNF